MGRIWAKEVILANKRDIHTIYLLCLLFFVRGRMADLTYEKYTTVLYCSKEQAL